MQTHRIYLNNRWEEGDDSFSVTDPGTGKSFATVTAIGADRTRQAIADAHAAFASWRHTMARDRADYLLAIAQGLKARSNEIARTIVRENGKPLAQAQAEMRATIDHFRWFAEEARRIYGRVVPQQDRGKRHMVMQVPVGVCAAIPPWNFPLMLAARKVAPALAAGCTVILRPARQTPLSAIMLAECVDQAGLPPGVFQLVTGPSQPIAQEFFRNPLCRKVSFTGSTEVGKELIAASAETITSLSLELGGHAPLLVFADADIDQAVQGALDAKFRNTGQSCIAANRIYVEASVAEAFTERFVRRVEAMKVGYGLDEGVEIGPLVNEDALSAALAHVDDARQRGARLLCGGEAVDRGGGFFLSPAVLVDVPEDALCMGVETFAPVAPILTFTSEDEAIRRANDTEYGLAAYAFTGNLSRAWRLAEQLEAGTIGINDGVTSTSQCPFGGMKQSGIGRELGPEGLLAFLEPRHISFANVD